MRINPILAKDLKKSALGRAKLKLFSKISGSEGYSPTKKQIVEFIESFSDEQHMLAEFFFSVLTIGNCRRQIFRGKANIANLNSALKKLDQFPVEKPVLYQFKTKYHDQELCAYVKGDRLRDVDGYVHTVIIFDHDAFPEELFSIIEVRSSQSAPEPAFNAAVGEKWKVFEKTDPAIFKDPALSICIDLLIDLANDNINSLVPMQQVSQPGFKKKLAPGLAGPKDKTLENLLAMVRQNKASCFLVELPLDQIIPHSYDHCFKIPLNVIKHAEESIESDNFTMLIYEKDGKYIMSDCYPAYLAFRKMGYEKVRVVIIGKEPPRGLSVIKKGGMELIPPIMVGPSGGYDDLDPSMKDLLLARYLKKLSVLDSSREIINSQCIVLTEDSKDIEMLEVLLQASEFNIDETLILSYKNCTNLDSLDITVKMVKKINPCTTLIIHRDRDYLLDQEVSNIVQRIKEADAIPFITNGTDVESYYINAAHIADLYPSLNPEVISTLIDRATNQTRAESIEFIKKHDHGERHKTKVSYLDDLISGIFESNKSRYRHGKKTLRVLKSLLQKETGNNVNITKPTLSLKDATLNEIALKIWNYGDAASPKAVDAIAD